MKLIGREIHLNALRSDLSNDKPIEVAFFDVGGTLGSVTTIDGALRLDAYVTSHTY